MNSNLFYILFIIIEFIFNLNKIHILEKFFIHNQQNISVTEIFLNFHTY